MEPQLSEEQKQGVIEACKRGLLFERLTHEEGWEYIQAFYQNKIQAFTNGLLLTDEPIEKFEAERNEIKGIRKLFGSIQDDIDTLHHENSKPTTE
jgi:hypothetical protein